MKEFYDPQINCRQILHVNARVNGITDLMDEVFIVRQANDLNATYRREDGGECAK